jgi:glutamate synthase (NADPH/NADH) small chain
MGKVTGFKDYERKNFVLAPIKERIGHFNEFITPLGKKEMQTQGARCMECGVPFCHSNFGCPLGNLVPQFNDQVYRGEWKKAYKTLVSTNNFPEFTGRVCPATCESACVLGINEPSVGIKNIEFSIIERAFKKGWVKPQIPKYRTTKTVAIIGSGPAGLACASELNKLGHNVTVYEKDSRIGGLLRYGIPNFKLDKDAIVQRRVDLMAQEGIKFVTGSEVGVEISAKELLSKHSAIVIATGAGKPRDLPIQNRDANGIHFAMDFLSQANCRVEGEKIPKDRSIMATNKRVVVIGGGDTGSDCVGTSIRQGAKSVTQIELLPKSPEHRTEDMPWPTYPRLFKLSSSQAEGSELDYSVLSKTFIKDENGNVKGIECVRIEWNGMDFKEIAGSEFVLEADLVLLAMGFLGPLQEDAIRELEINTDERSNIVSSNYKTSVDKVFCAGDARRGQSLVVWAIYEGRKCARAVDEFIAVS